LTYDANNAYFSLARIASFASVGETPNQIATGRAVETLGFGNPIFDIVLSGTAAQAREAFDALSGEVHATVSGVLVSDSHYVRDALRGRLIQGHYTDAPNLAVALAAGGPTAVAPSDMSGRMALGAGIDHGATPAYREPLTFWTQGFGSWGEFAGNGNAAAAQRNLGGFISVMDADIGDGWRAGLATGYMQSNINVDARASSAAVNSYILGAYSEVGAGPLALRSGVAWTWHAIDSSRSVIFPGFYESESASYNAKTAQLFGEVAYPILTNHGAVEPFAGLAQVHFNTDGFTESGATAALTTSHATQNVGYSTLGVRAAAAAEPVAGVTVTPHGCVAWQYSFGDTTPAQAFAFASNGILFEISGVPIVPNSALIEVGLDIDFAPDATLGLSYVGQLAGELRDNGVQGRLNWRF
jgi:outer membrane autotransporter protein